MNFSVSSSLSFKPVISKIFTRRSRQAGASLSPCFVAMGSCLPVIRASRAPSARNLRRNPRGTGSLPPAAAPTLPPAMSTGCRADHIGSSPSAITRSPLPSASRKTWRSLRGGAKRRSSQRALSGRSSGSAILFLGSGGPTRRIERSETRFRRALPLTSSDWFFLGKPTSTIASATCPKVSAPPALEFSPKTTSLGRTRVGNRSRCGWRGRRNGRNISRCWSVDGTVPRLSL